MVKISGSAKNRELIVEMQMFQTTNKLKLMLLKSAKFAVWV